MIQSVAFAGLGAVGAIYAQLAVRCPQASCFAIVREKASYAENPVFVSGERVEIALRTPDEPQIADLIIVAVKWHVMDEVLEQIAPFVGEGTIILSLLNGISSEQVIAARFPQSRVLLAMCSGIDANRQGRAVKMNRRGRIVFGEADGRMSEAVCDVAQYFAAAGIPHEAAPDMRRQMWWKLMVNVGMNQVSAVMNLDYEGMRTSREAMDRMHRAQREVIAVANGLGIALGEADVQAWDAQLAGLSRCGFSSTLADVRGRRKTEVELYGETVCRLGKALGIATPENARLVEEIHAIETAY